MPADTADDGSVRVDLQLVLPSAAGRVSSKLPPAALEDSSSGSSCAGSEISSQGSSMEGEGDTAGSVLVEVGPAEAAGRQQAAIAAGNADSSATQASKPAVLAASSGLAQSTAISSSTIAAAEAEATDDDGDDEGLCTICYDQPATCVLMECGHGGYCWRCAHVLFARPPSECPVCRQSIMQVGLGINRTKGWCGLWAAPMHCRLDFLAWHCHTTFHPSGYESVRHSLPSHSNTPPFLSFPQHKHIMLRLVDAVYMQVVELEDPSCQVGRRVLVKPPARTLSRTLSKSGSGSWFK